MILFYTGRRGCGKTTTMIKDAHHFKDRGWTIVTNMHSLTFADMVLSNEEILALLETTMNNFVIVIDEVQTFIDSRRSMRKRNVNFTYFIQQIRKRNVVILATTQFSRRVDIAFREHADILVRPRFYPSYPVIVVTYVDLTLVEESFYDESLGTGVIETVYDPRSVFSLFDTREVISPQHNEQEQ